VHLVSILIPSRLASIPSPVAEKPNRLFVERAVESIRSQTIAGRVNFQIVVGVDAGAATPPELATDFGIIFAESGSRSQAAALNAAAKLAQGDVVAILEDDDRWEPQFLERAIEALEKVGFTSSTQLEVTPNDAVIRINDFPTPSGWVMRREVWEAVGGFDERFRWHLDNDFLGRLSEKNVLRHHLIEATAPIDIGAMQQVRPWLVNCLKLGGRMVRLARHDSPWPLVRRLIHPESGMQRIARDPTLVSESQSEYRAIIQRYGRIPW
jgi:glycosyltransferase involved in cell wall biosynthesis